VLLGWFFSPDDRAKRLAMLLQASEPVGAQELRELLTDVMAPASLEIRDWLLAELAPPPQDCPVFDALSRWDGRYEAGSPGALAFELFVARLIEAEIPAARRAAFGVAWHSRRLLLQELELLPPARRTTALQKALAAARPAFRRLQDWGGAHRLRLAHPLAALRRLGRRYGAIERPWPGSSDTVFKSSHGLVTGRHDVGYGSNARYIFDLSDPDANSLVLLGGQDGVPGSAAFLDQAELFRRGEYIKVPLRPDTARARFRHWTLLEP
jgi:penicillin amidase